MSNKNGRNCWKRSCLALFILLGLTNAGLPDHALYIGVVQISHDEKESETTIQIKVFSDDLQSVLQNELGFEEVPSISALCTFAADPLETYFNTQLEIKVNQQVVDLNLVNCEEINDIHLLTFKTNQENDWKTCSINAPFFMELFPLQSNIINLKYTALDATTIQKMGRVSKGNGVLEFKF